MSVMVHFERETAETVTGQLYVLAQHDKLGILNIGDDYAELSSLNFDALLALTPLGVKMVPAVSEIQKPAPLILAA